MQIIYISIYSEAVRMGFGENMKGRYTWYQHIMQKSPCYHMLYGIVCMYSSKVMVHRVTLYSLWYQ